MIAALSVITVARVFCDRQKSDPQFVRQSDPQFVRPKQNASFVQPINKMRHLSDLYINASFVRPMQNVSFVRPRQNASFVPPIHKMSHLSDLYIKCVICPTCT
jgi:hypothetical protein